MGNELSEEYKLKRAVENGYSKYYSFRLELSNIYSNRVRYKVKGYTKSCTWTSDKDLRSVLAKKVFTSNNSSSFKCGSAFLSKEFDGVYLYVCKEVNSDLKYANGTLSLFDENYISGEKWKNVDSIFFDEHLDLTKGTYFNCFDSYLVREYLINSPPDVIAFNARKPDNYVRGADLRDFIGQRVLINRNFEFSLNGIKIYQNKNDKTDYIFVLLREETEVEFDTDEEYILYDTLGDLKETENNKEEATGGSNMEMKLDINAMIQVKALDKILGDGKITNGKLMQMSMIIESTGGKLTDLAKTKIMAKFFSEKEEDMDIEKLMLFKQLNEGRFDPSEIMQFRMMSSIYESLGDVFDEK